MCCAYFLAIIKLAIGEKKCRWHFESVQSFCWMSSNFIIIKSSQTNSVHPPTCNAGRYWKEQRARFLRRPRWILSKWSFFREHAVQICRRIMNSQSKWTSANGVWIIGHNHYWLSQLQFTRDESWTFVDSSIYCCCLFAVIVAINLGRQIFLSARRIYSGQSAVGCYYFFECLQRTFLMMPEIFRCKNLSLNFGVAKTKQTH